MEKPTAEGFPLFGSPGRETAQDGSAGMEGCGQRAGPHTALLALWGFHVVCCGSLLPTGEGCVWAPRLLGRRTSGPQGTKTPNQSHRFQGNPGLLKMPSSSPAR